MIVRLTTDELELIERGMECAALILKNSPVALDKMTHEEQKLLGKELDTIGKSLRLRGACQGVKVG